MLLQQAASTNLNSNTHVYKTFYSDIELSLFQYEYMYMYLTNSIIYLY